MSNLQQLALGRLQGQLPVFPGATLAEQLQSGRAQAEASLRKYAPDFRFDIDEARDVMSQVDAWVTRNEDSLSQAMTSPEQKLPAWLVVNLGNAQLVQQWVIANFTVAAAGLGPWISGRLGQAVADPASTISPAWAEEDGQSRLQSFAMLVKMDRDGELAYIFQGPQSAVQGLGVAPMVIWAIVVAFVAFAAVVVTYFYLDKRLALNNKTMNDLCLKAQEEGDRATVEKCIEATKDLQTGDPVTAFAEQVGKIALLLGGGYLLIRFALPELGKQTLARRRAR